MSTLHELRAGAMTDAQLQANIRTYASAHHPDTVARREACIAEVARRAELLRDEDQATHHGPWCDDDPASACADCQPDPPATEDPIGHNRRGWTFTCPVCSLFDQDWPSEFSACEGLDHHIAELHPDTVDDLGEFADRTFVCWCGSVVALRSAYEGTCGSATCLRYEAQDRQGLIP